MENKEGYKVVSIPGDGDCFFSTVEKGMSAVKQLNVTDMRNHLAEKADADLFRLYRSQYKDAIATLKSKNISTFERESANEQLTEYGWMKGVRSLKSMKEKLKQKDYWADAWGIARLEKYLKVKMIILTTDNEVRCTEMDKDWVPTHFIITKYNGIHYDLITYNNMGALVSSEIPDELRTLINEKCKWNI